MASCGYFYTLFFSDIENLLNVLYIVIISISELVGDMFILLTFCLFIFLVILCAR